MKRTYRCAEVEDKKMGSLMFEWLEKKFIEDEIRTEYYEQLKREIEDDDSIGDKQKALDELSDRIFDKNLTLDDIRSEMEEKDKENGDNFYTDIYDIATERGKQNVNAFSENKFKAVDGAAFITPEMTAKLLRMRGRYTENVAKAFQRLKEDKYGKDILSSQEDYLTILNALIGAEKYSAYGYRMLNISGESIPVHYYDKFALFPIFPQFAYGFSSALLQKMQDQTIDMLMMHSAVKTGSPEASYFEQDQFETAQQFKDFEFNVYEQDFAFIRRQLNTDPHETDEGAMGTQMAKIALANLDPNRKYTTSDGATVRGRDLLDNIMTAINELARIGYDELKEELFVSGTNKLDMEKFSAFLEEELERRDADENLIDAVKLNDEGTDLNLPLEAVSSVDWIQSILVSIINKRIIDINVEGNAFYQRSVWGMEGKPTILTENALKRTINNGNPLRMINEEGSMDAVVSIDYFYNVIPKQIRYNFKKSKQWLIDHDFISGVKTGTDVWHNATAQTVASRIPTQAQSSIHALRFVDVLPITRATIVLPMEFVPITGSDFDIDKLYMVSLSYKVSTKYKKEGDKSIPYDEVTSSFEVGSKNYHRNELINSFITLLKNHGKLIENQEYEHENQLLDTKLEDLNLSVKTSKKLIDNDIKTLRQLVSLTKKEANEKFGKKAYSELNDLLESLNLEFGYKIQTVSKINGLVGGGDLNISMRPVDKDTEKLLNVLSRIDKGSTVEREYAYKFGNLAFQVETKAAFILGKFGIGPFALNNNSQILTQLFGVKFIDEPNSILTQLGITRLDVAKDKQNIDKLSWLSGLINAHVDVAKDPWIVKLNVNTFTYNLTNLLIRGGMGERTFLFLTQPIMKEMASAYQSAAGSYMVDQSKSKTQRQRDAVEDCVVHNFAKSRIDSKGKMGDVSSKQILRMMMHYTEKEDLENRDKTDHKIEMIVGSFAKALFGINDDGSYSNTIVRLDEYGNPEENTYENMCILEDVLTNPDCRINDKNPATVDNLSDRSMYRVKVLNEQGETVEMDMSPRMVQLYVAYIYKSLEKYGTALSDLVNSCKIDTKKHGKSFVEQQAYLRKYHNTFAYYPDEDKDVISKFFDQQSLDNLRENSYIGNKTDLATKLFKEVLQNFSCQATDDFINLHEQIITRLNSSVENKKLSTKVTKAIMKYLKTQFFDTYTSLNEDEDYVQNLFYGKDSLQNMLFKIQKLIKNNKKGIFDEYLSGGKIKNALLRSLMADIAEHKKDFMPLNFIKLENALMDDSEDMNTIERAWNELFEDDTEYKGLKRNGKQYTMRQFAIDLAIYAFYTSGDEVGATKFFKYVPNPIREEIGYADFMRNSSDHLYAILKDPRCVDNIIAQNWNDNDFVKLYRRKSYKTSNFIEFRWLKRNIRLAKIEKDLYSKITGEVNWNIDYITKRIPLLIGALRHTKRGDSIVTVKPNKEGSYPAFIKIRRFSHDRYSSDTMLLYKFAGTTVEDPLDKFSKTFPLYVLVNPPSSSVHAGTYNYNIINPTFPNGEPRMGISYDEQTTDAIYFLDDLQQNQTALTNKEGDIKKFGSIKKLADAFISAFKKVHVFMNEREVAQLFNKEIETRYYFNEEDNEERPGLLSFDDELKKYKKLKIKNRSKLLEEFTKYILDVLDVPSENKTEESKKSDKKGSNKTTKSKKRPDVSDEYEDETEEYDEQEDDEFGSIRNIALKIAKKDDNESLTKKKESVRKKESKKSKQEDDKFGSIRNIALKIAKNDGKKESKKKQQKKIIELNEASLKLEKFKKLSTTTKSIFKVNGITFNSVYQYREYQFVDYYDASEEEKEEMRDEILNTTSHSDFVDLGRQYSQEIENYKDVRSRNMQELTREGLYYAYSDSRNEELKKLLLSTGDAVIVGSTVSVNNAYMEAREKLKKFDDSNISNEAELKCKK